MEAASTEYRTLWARWAGRIGIAAASPIFQAWWLKPLWKKYWQGCPGEQELGRQWQEMLSSLARKLRCPACWRQDGGLVLQVFRASDTAGAVRDGVLVCELCSAWYSIDDHLLDLEPLALQDESDRAAFASRFKT